MNFLSKDGYILTEEFISLARDIDKYAAAEGLKPAEVYYSAKLIPKYDKVKAKEKGEAFTKKRIQMIKVRKKMPAAGSRIKMVIVLRLYKGIEDTDFGDEINQALDAIDAHNEKAEAAITKDKAQAKKNREASGKDFDKNLKVVESMLSKLNLKSSSIAIGQSAMGKSMVIKLPNGGYISIGKADAAKFEKAKQSKSQ